MRPRVFRLLSIVYIVALTPVLADVLTPTEQLGKSAFFDLNLSIYQNQSCAACHGPAVGWTGPISTVNAHGAVYEGSIAGRFGDRKPPSAAYATLAPILHWSEKAGLWIGGNFWDGRATGEKLANPAADQAQGPFLNPAEQALPDSACVIWRVCEPVVPADYPVSFEEVWGDTACDIVWPADIEVVCSTEGAVVSLSPADRAKVDAAYDDLALAIAAYEDSREVNAFSSKFDRNFGKLTTTEKLGFSLFRGKGKCALCHLANGKKALFTDFTYDNLGVPKNLENPVYDVNPSFVDLGLGGFLMAAGHPPEVYESEMGKVKVPTLRNVDLRPGTSFVKAFGHNGYFKSLEEIVHFYNTRDVLPTCDSGDPGEKITCWPPPEVAQNVNTSELGDLGLTATEEAALVAFLKTLSDGYVPPPSYGGTNVIRRWVILN